MSARFFYEDGLGKLINEEDNDAMAWNAESQPFHLKLWLASDFIVRHKKNNRSKRMLG